MCVCFVALTIFQLTFSYTLSRANLPPGKLSFRFEVRPAGNAAAAAHTVHELSYQLSTHAAATQLTYPREANLGQTVTITTVPAAFPDQRTVQPFDVSGGAAEKRKFFLDVRSRQGAVVNTIAGVAGAGGKYTFALKLDAVLESLGTHVLSFRYQSADGRDFALQPYDSQHNEVIEPATRVNVTVATKLTLSDVVSIPSAGDFSYGAPLLGLRPRISLTFGRQ